MTEPEAKAEAERICDEMDARHGLWLQHDKYIPNEERYDWIEKIAAALMHREPAPAKGEA